MVFMGELLESRKHATLHPIGVNWSFCLVVAGRCFLSTRRVMEIAGLLGDAFQADEEKSQKKYGHSLQKEHEELHFESSEDTFSIDPKCNSVCLMKADKRSYRNMIAVSENYICYTVKGSLLRVLHSQTGEKVLLRGHESPVLDVRFSPADSSVLCSVDAGDSDAHHTFLWQLQTVDNNAVKQELIFSIPLKANNVKSHPLSSKLWAISHGSRLGLFHADNDRNANAYNELKFHMTFKDELVDFCFSPDGLFMAVITGKDSNSSVGVFKLNGARDDAEMMCGRYKLQPYSAIQQFKGRILSGISFLPLSHNSYDCTLVTLSDRSSMDSATMFLDIYVWNFNGGKRDCLQTVSLLLPQTAQSTSTEFPLSTLTNDSLENRFLCVSNKNSRIVACLGVGDGSANRLYHCTFLNLKYGVSSVVNSTVHMMENDEAGRSPESHVGITCCQDQQNGQYAVQQYHVPSRWVFQPPSPRVSMSTDSSTLLKSMLGSKNDIVTPPVPPLDESDKKSTGGISILTKDDGTSLSSLPIGSFPDFALISSSQPSKDVALSSELPTQQVDIGVKSKKILLNALKVGTSTASDAKLSSTQKAATSLTISKPNATPIMAHRNGGLKEQQQQSHDDEEDDWEKASNSISQSQPTTPLVSSEKSSTTPNSFESKLDQVLATSHRLEEKFVTSEKQRIKKAKATEASIPKALGDVKADIVSDVLQGMEQINMKAMSTAIEQHSHKAVAEILESEKWRQQLSAQVSADLKRELTPTIAQSIRFAVKENVKANLLDCLRTCFETTIVPAYEAGSREMFSQLQQSLASGVEVMKQNNIAVGVNYEKEVASLRSELSSLRSTISSLESKIEHLTIPVTEKPVESSRNAGNGRNVEFETDFRQLFREGRKGESLEMALELKDVNSVLWILEQQCESPSGLSALCDNTTALCILCTVQQLSADFAMNEPKEGVRRRMDCLKEMIMYLIDCDPPEEKISPIVNSTQENLKKAEAKHTLVGSNRTDMKMLCSILSTSFQ